MPLIGRNESEQKSLSEDAGFNLSLTSGYQTIQYNPSQSSTTNGPLSSDWSIGYADSSSASGSLYQDTITLAGQTVTDQCVAVVSNSVIDTDG